MSSKGETQFRKRIYPDLVALPNTVIFPISQKSIRGTPDFLICCNSMFIALELKSDEGKLDKLQEYNLEKVNKVARGIGLVARPENWQKTKELLWEIAISNIEQIEFKTKQ